MALTLNYLYSGQPAKAWAELDRLYHGPDKLFVWSQILRAIAGSPFYKPGGMLPELPIPESYALQLLPDCVSIGIRPADQPTSDPAPIRRYRNWLEDELWRAGALREGEMLQVSPGDDGSGCRAEIVRSGTKTSLGVIDLDLTGGSAGQVRRMNRKGREVGAWRLRGDLTWEAIGP